MDELLQPQEVKHIFQGDWGLQSLCGHGPGDEGVVMGARGQNASGGATKGDGDSAEQ